MDTEALAQETRKERKERKRAEKEAQEAKGLAKFTDGLQTFALHGVAGRKWMSNYAMAQIHDPELARSIRASARHIRTQFGEDPNVPHLKESDQGVPVQYGERTRETAEVYQGDPMAAPAPGSVAGGPPVDMNTVLGTMDKQSYDDAVRFACEFNNSAARNGKAPMTWEEAVQLRAQGKTRFDLGF
jgi:hypothetical protein